jgi:hypothetical protein
MITLTREGNNKLAAKQLQDLFSSMTRQEPKNAELYYRIVSAVLSRDAPMGDVASRDPHMGDVASRDPHMHTFAWWLRSDQTARGPHGTPRRFSRSLNRECPAPPRPALSLPLQAKPFARLACGDFSLLSITYLMADRAAQLRNDHAPYVREGAGEGRGRGRARQGD